MYALVDCNNFYVSCERVFRPDLRDRPVVVLSNNDGCVVSRSEEAKRLGIGMAAPAYQYETLFREQGVTVFSSNYPLYGDMSNRVMNILSEFAPDLEIYSIDECFLNFEGCEYADLEAIGKQICRIIPQYTGIPVCIGFAPTKTLAKAANNIAKKFRDRTAGIYIIDSDEKRIKALKWMSIESVWGIGYRTAKKLRQYKVGDEPISKAIHFTQLSDDFIQSNFSVTGVRLKRELLGYPMIEREEMEIRKNIATTRSFEKNYTRIEEIRERVSTFAVSCAEKLRKQAMHCNSLMVFLMTNRHRNDQPQYNPSTVIKLPFPSNSSIEIAHYAVEGLSRIFKEGYSYKKAGVVIMEFTPDDEVQVNMFENSNPKHKPLMQTVDKINRYWGEQKIRLGAQDLKQDWKMRQDSLSPRYTTRVKDVIVVHV